jgi:hypothetical protein
MPLNEYHDWTDGHLNAEVQKLREQISSVTHTLFIRKFDEKPDSEVINILSSNRDKLLIELHDIEEELRGRRKENREAFPIIPGQLPSGPMPEMRQLGLQAQDQYRAKAEAKKRVQRKLLSKFRPPKFP